MASESSLNQKGVCSDKNRVDRLNHLPEEVIDVILKHLSLQDVVRTSVLSKKWRFKWRSISDLVFCSLSPSRAYMRNGKTEMARIVDHILMLHNGSKISRFEFPYGSVYSTDVDRWIILLEKKSVEQLILSLSLLALEGKLYTLPSNFFLLQHLNLLELSYCELKLPNDTNGFHNLTCLHLEAVILTDEAVRSLISSSPLLKDLSLTKIGFTYLRIYAPNLTKFFFRGRCGDITFDTTTKLANAYIKVQERTEITSSHEADRLEDVLASFVDIQKLYISKCFMEMLTVYIIPESLPLTYDNLRSIELSFTFKDPKEFSIALCLLGSSLCLEEIKIKIKSFYDEDYCRVDEDFWKQYKFNLPKLKTVKLLNFNAEESAMMFVKFILNSAMVLETFNIKWPIGPEGLQYTRTWYDKRLCVVEKMNKFHRASPRAEVTFGR